MPTAKVINGDSLEVLPTLESDSVDAVITDPPYPCIKRSYGFWTEAEWFDMMRPVVRECMRILKPTGSAVFILQPNSERIGKMRLWLWEFMLWVGKEYGIVQDAYWWNHAAFPEAHAIQGRLMRPSLKTCVWVGKADCWRDQESVLWSESQANVALRTSARLGRQVFPGGQCLTETTISGAAVRRGGVTPFNVLPFANTDSQSSAGAHGHGAGTPLALCRWWTRYICPSGGVVLDPFGGSGTVALAAMQECRSSVLIERDAGYVEIARKRLAAEEAKQPLFAGVV